MYKLPQEFNITIQEIVCMVKVPIYSSYLLLTVELYDDKNDEAFAISLLE